MSGFATLAPPYSMPSASHGDVELSDSTTNSQSRALNQFLAGVELKAFKIAQAALRHEDDALDAVQDAMLQLAVPIPTPAEEWRPLFYRILENRIRDMQRRRTVRGRVMSWLPFRATTRRRGAGPIAQAPSFDPQPPVGSRYPKPWTRSRKRSSRCLAASSRCSSSDPGGSGCSGDCDGDGLLGRQRQDTLLPRVAVAPRATWRFLDMSPPAPVGHETPGEFEQHARALLEQSVQRVDGRIRSRLNQARHAAIEQASPTPLTAARFTLMPAVSAVATAVLVAFVLWPHSHSGDPLVAKAAAARVSRIWIYWQTVMRSTSSPTSRPIPGSFTSGRWIKRIRTRRAAPVPRHAPAVASACWCTVSARTRV